MAERGTVVVGTGFIGPVHVETLRRLGRPVRGVLAGTECLASFVEDAPAVEPGRARNDLSGGNLGVLAGFLIVLASSVLPWTRFADPRLYRLAGRLFVYWNSGWHEPQNHQFLQELDPVSLRPVGIFPAPTQWPLGAA